MLKAVHPTNTSTSLLPQGCAPASRCLQIWHVGGGSGEGSGTLSPTHLSLNCGDLSVSSSRGGKGVQRKNQNNPSTQASDYLNWAQLSPSTSQSLLWNKRADNDLQQFGMIHTHTQHVYTYCSVILKLTKHQKAGRVSGSGLQHWCVLLPSIAAEPASAVFPQCRLRAQWT